MNDEIKGLVERLKESAEAFRKHPIFTADGDPVFLKVQADELTEAAAALTLSDEARVRAEREVETLKADIRVLIGSSSRADNAASDAARPDCSAAQSLDGKGEL